MYVHYFKLLQDPSHYYIITLNYVAKQEFSAKRRKLSANVEIFPQTGSGQERTLWDPAEASIISCHAQACPCASFLTAA